MHIHTHLDVHCHKLKFKIEYKYCILKKTTRIWILMKYLITILKIWIIIIKTDHSTHIRFVVG